MAENTVRISYFSDVLCIWAYVSQIRLDELQRHFEDRVEIQYHFLPVFGSTETRIGQGWKDREGFAGYARHVQEIAREFPHLAIHPSTWITDIPHSSGIAHLFLKSVQLLEEKDKISDQPEERYGGRSLFEDLVWRTRQAFFAENTNMGRLHQLLALTEPYDAISSREIEDQISNGEAMASFCRDVDLAKKMLVEGSPTFVMNEGRQKLYGNVGYKILEANVQEMLERPSRRASWC